MRAALFAAAALGLSAPAASAPILESKFELFVATPAESARLYAALGFSIAHAKPDGYTTLTSGGTVVALSPLPWWLPLWLAGWLRRPPLGTEIVLYTAELEGLRERLLAAGYEPGEIALQPWGDRDFRITDPDGYYLRISEGRAVPVGAAPSEDDRR